MSVNIEPGWINRLNDQYIHVVQRLKTAQASHFSIHLHEFTKGLFQSFKTKSPECKNREILNRISYLADKQIEYYKSCKFSFIEIFFSALRNFFVFGEFHSSAYLAKRKSSELLLKLEEDKPSKNPINRDLFVNLRSKKNRAIVQGNLKLPYFVKKIKNTAKQFRIRKSQFLRNKPLLMKKKMMHDLNRAWSLYDKSAMFITAFWEILLKDIKIQNWEKIKSRPLKFCITLTPIKGKINFFNVAINKKIVFTIREDETKKMIKFSTGVNEGLVGSKGPVSIKLALVEIANSLSQDPNECLATFTAILPLGIKKKISIKPSEALKYLKLISWET